MTLTILLDLDDTLLDSNIKSFIPAYFQALSKHLEGWVSPEILMPALISGTQAMNQNDNPTRTLQEVFASDFYQRLDVQQDDLKAGIDQFYDDVFPSLRKLTKIRPEAKLFVEWAFFQGFRIAIATDPLFPRQATYQRLQWAGFDPNQFEVVSTYDDFHFTKTHPAYYAEVLGRMGWPDGPILVVGNDPLRDITPAQILGLATYYLTNSTVLDPELTTEGRGKLTDLRPWLEASDFSRFEPGFNSPEAFLAILLATPAALAGLSTALTDTEWSHEPTPGDWAFKEIICHLRDTEKEIHQMQINLFEEQLQPFIPRPDAGVWARQRDYLAENGTLALTQFAAARLETMGMLKGIKAEEWSREARHAIFGPTTFLEVIGFMTEHDRLHIQQAWKTLHEIRVS
jgi:FMN phosphatase YigB (HAD superfamily)